MYLQDSTTIGLPPAFAHLWPGGGQEAAVKLQVRIDYLHGTLFGPFLQAAERHDRASVVQKMPITQGAIRLADLGYFSLDCLNQINNNEGYYLSRIQVQTHLFDRYGRQLDLPKWLAHQHIDEIDMPILLGQHHRIKTRPTSPGVCQRWSHKNAAESSFFLPNAKDKNPQKHDWLFVIGRFW